MTNLIFVGALARQVDSDELARIFSTEWQVRSSRVVLSEKDGKSRGFGFVEFDSVATACSAKAAMDGQVIHGKPIFINFS